MPEHCGVEPYAYDTLRVALSDCHPSVLKLAISKVRMKAETLSWSLWLAIYNTQNVQIGPHDAANLRVFSERAKVFAEKVSNPGELLELLDCPIHPNKTLSSDNMPLSSNNMPLSANKGMLLVRKKVGCQER